jgi:hypothetical protein
MEKVHYGQHLKPVNIMTKIFIYLFPMLFVGNLMAQSNYFEIENNEVRLVIDYKIEKEDSLCIFTIVSSLRNVSIDSLIVKPIDLLWLEPNSGEIVLGSQTKSFTSGKSQTKIVAFLPPSETMSSDTVMIKCRCIENGDLNVLNISQNDLTITFNYINFNKLKKEHKFLNLLPAKQEKYIKNSMVVYWLNPDEYSKNCQWLIIKVPMKISQLN